MKIALCGLSSTGKSTVAKIISELIDAKTRHCGDIVKERARQLDVSPEELPTVVHNEIDQETKRLINDTNTPLIVEGRYLAEILCKVSDVLLFELSCSDEERKNRFLFRNKHNIISSQTLEEQDELTARLRVKLYGYIGDVRARLMRIDTTNQTPLQVAQHILNHANAVSKNKIQPTAPISRDDSG